MTAITFDTLKFADRLEKAGLPREQAAAIVEAQRESLAEALDTTLATKADVRELKADISRLENNMEKMELRLTIKLGALIAASAGIIIAVLRVAH